MHEHGCLAQVRPEVLDAVADALLHPGALGVVLEEPARRTRAPPRSRRRPAGRRLADRHAAAPGSVTTTQCQPWRFEPDGACRAISTHSADQLQRDVAGQVEPLADRAGGGAGARRGSAGASSCASSCLRHGADSTRGRRPDRAAAGRPARPARAARRWPTSSPRSGRAAARSSCRRRPGTGKTTLVPPAVAAAVRRSRRRDPAAPDRRPRRRPPAGAPARRAGRPRRSGTRSAARAATSAGDADRGGDDRASCCAACSATRSCAGVGAVVLDEVHERHLDGDLALALLVDVRAQPARRPGGGRDVRDRRGGADGGAAGRRARRDASPGALHPVDVVWCPPPPRVARTDERGVTPGFLDHVAATVRRALDGARRRRPRVPAGRRARSAESRGGSRASTSTSARCTAGCRPATRTSPWRPGRAAGWSSRRPSPSRR